MSYTLMSIYTITYYLYYSVGFKPLTVLKLAKQLLQRLHTLSVYNIVHGDIQPGNMLLGTLCHTLISSKFLSYFILIFALFLAYFL